MRALQLRAEVEDKSFKCWYMPEFDKPSQHAVITAEIPNYESFLKKRTETRLLKIKKASETDEMPPFYEEPLLDRQQEYHLFRKMNFYKHHFCKLAKRFTERTPAKQVQKAEDFLKKAHALRHQLVCSNTRLTAQVIKKGDEFFRAHSLIGDVMGDACLNIVKAVDLFDFRRGFKFSTYATWVLLNNCRRDNTGARKFNEFFVTGFDDNVYNDRLDTSDEERRDSEETKDMFKQYANKLLGLLDRKEDQRKRYAIEQWFGLTNQKRTLKDISADMDLTKERVRQLRVRGIERIRERIREEGIVLEGIDLESLLAKA